MERIHYAGDSLLTGTHIANALLDYAYALAGRNQAATVTIPIRRQDGSLSHARMLIGAGSGLVAKPEDSPFEEIVDTLLVDSLTTESARLGGIRPVAAEFAPDESARLDGL